MPVAPAHRLFRFLLPAGGAVLGFWAAFLLRPQAGTTGSGSGHGERGRLPAGESVVPMATMRKRASLPAVGDSHELTFSREQWKQLLRKHHAYFVDLSECLRWQRAKLTPVAGLDSEKPWGFDGFVSSQVDGGPDVEPVAHFLGLDETRKSQLRDCLKRFGEELRTIEREHAAIAYAGDGTARISFGDGAAARDALLPGLKDELFAALGERDCSRFIAVSGLFDEGKLPHELSLSVEVTEKFVSTKVEGSSEVVAFWEEKNGEVPGVEEHASRLGHLGQEIDWLRLHEEAKGKTTP